MSNLILLSVNPNNNTRLFAQIANSTPITNTTVENSLIGNGVGSLTVPAYSFNRGDSFMGSMAGHIDSLNNEYFRIKVKSGSVILGDTGLIKLGQCTNQHWDLQLRFTVRTLGPAGAASIASFGQFTYSKDASDTFEGIDFSTINNTTFDTWINNTLDVTAQWSSASISNNIYSETFILNKIY